MARIIDFTFLDAGQGDATIIAIGGDDHWNGSTLIWVDCGSTKNGATVQPDLVGNIALRLQPGVVIDTVVVTHPHRDHFNGFNTVIRALEAMGKTVRFRQLFYGGVRQDYPRNFFDIFTSRGAVDIGPCTAWALPQQIALASAPMPAGLTINCWANVLGMANREVNERGIVLGFTIPNPRDASSPYKVFMMGDATMAVEQEILAQLGTVAPGEAARVLGRGAGTVLKMGHHGSRTSSCEEWVRALQPDSLVISSDTKRFGGGASIPQRSHIDNVRSWTTVAQNSPTPHSYYVWEDDTTSVFYDFHIPQPMSATQLPPPTPTPATGSPDMVCTTLWKLDYTFVFGQPQPWWFSAYGSWWWWRFDDDPATPLYIHASMYTTRTPA